MNDPLINNHKLSEFLRYVTPSLIAEKFTVNPYNKRWGYEAWLKNNGRIYIHEHKLTDVTTKGLSKWIDEVRELEYVRGISRIDVDYDNGMCASWEELIPLTAEERKEAEEWLKAHPQKEGETVRIKFRSPLLTKENE